MSDDKELWEKLEREADTRAVVAAAKLYKLRLFEQESMGTVSATRVPGGWVISNAIGGMCFVPFNNEFQKIHI